MLKNYIKLLNMTPKERAINLYVMFYERQSDDLSMEGAKKEALWYAHQAVDLVIEAMEGIVGTYWQQVKNELNEIKKTNHA